MFAPFQVASPDSPPQKQTVFPWPGGCVLPEALHVFQQVPTFRTEVCPPARTLGMDHFNSAMGPGVFSILTLCLSCNQTVYQEGYQQILCALLPLDGTGIELKKP